MEQLNLFKSNDDIEKQAYLFCAIELNRIAENLQFTKGTPENTKDLFKQTIIKIAKQIIDVEIAV